MRTNAKGFTLIELLVVIAIIGILAASILFATGSARASAGDASVKTNLSNARQQAEVFANANSGSYAGVCTAAQSANGLTDILTAAKSAGGQSGTVNTTLATAGTWNTVSCHDSATGWAIQAPYRGSTSTTPSFQCIDSTGSNKTTATVLAASSVVCP